MAQDSEKKETLQSLPPAVQQAVTAQGQGDTSRGLPKEANGGVTVNEAEMTVDGRDKVDSW